MTSIEQFTILFELVPIIEIFLYLSYLILVVKILSLAYTRKIVSNKNVTFVSRRAPIIALNCRFYYLLEKILYLVSKDRN